MQEIYIKNANGDLEKVVVSDQVAELLETFRREDAAEQRQLRRHIKHSGGADVSYEEWMGGYEFEDQLINSLQLRKALSSLSDKQRQRLLQYYIMGYTYRKIAEMEGVTDTAVKQNINKIIKKLKKFLI